MFYLHHASRHLPVIETLHIHSPSSVPNEKQRQRYFSIKIMGLAGLYYTDPIRAMEEVFGGVYLEIFCHHRFLGGCTDFCALCELAGISLNSNLDYL